MADAPDISGFLSSMGEARRRAEAAALRGLDQGGEALLARSKKLVPVSPTNPKHPGYTGTSGALRDSGTTAPATISGTIVTKEVGYHTNYAAAVHERLDLNHRYPGAPNPNGQAKFLEQPAKEMASKIAAMIHRAISEALR